MKTYRDLIVWQKAMMLVENVYLLTNEFPSEEKFGLTSQMRRCSISVPSNIAEGYGRFYTKDYVRILQIARGSLYECQTQLEIAIRLNYIQKEQSDLTSAISGEIEKMLNALIRKLNAYPLGLY